jgi:hypothetical protein
MTAYRDMNAEQRSEMFAAKRAAVDAVAAEIKARPRIADDPRSLADYRIFKTMKLFCVPLVRHALSGTLELSRDGWMRPRAFINPAKLIEQPESDGDLMLVLIDKGLAAWVKEKQRCNLFGVAPDLSSEREWTDHERAVWKRLRRLSDTINTRIASPPRPRALLSRSEAA